jgi:hypothetical protein
MSSMTRQIRYDEIFVHEILDATASSRLLENGHLVLQTLDKSVCEIASASHWSNITLRPQDFHLLQR